MQKNKLRKIGKKIKLILNVVEKQLTKMKRLI